MTLQMALTVLMLQRPDFACSASARPSSPPRLWQQILLKDLGHQVAFTIVAPFRSTRRLAAEPYDLVIVAHPVHGGARQSGELAAGQSHRDRARRHRPCGQGRSPAPRHLDARGVQENPARARARLLTATRRCPTSRVGWRPRCSPRPASLRRSGRRRGWQCLAPGPTSSQRM